MYSHWTNPWTDAVSVPIEELAACVDHLGERCGRMDGSSFIMTVETTLDHWRAAGPKLDAYVLLCPSGWHCMGIRYGNEPSHYLSPGGNPAKILALHKKYTQKEIK